MTYQIHTKASWDQKMSGTWQDSFYPSLVKKIEKSCDYFEELFRLDIKDLNNINETKDFFELYDKEIVARSNYLFKPNEQKDLLEHRLATGRKYLLVSLIKTDSSTFSGGIVMANRNGRLIFSLRSIDSEIRNEFKSVTTVDFWVEKKIYEYALSQNFEVLSHGTDNYPNKGRTGLILYKLKVGVKPKISPKEHNILKLSNEDVIKFGMPTFFWDLPDENKYFRRANLVFQPDKIDPNVLSEMTKVLEWAGIEFNQVEY